MACSGWPQPLWWATPTGHYRFSNMNIWGGFLSIADGTLRERLMKRLIDRTEQFKVFCSDYAWSVSIAHPTFLFGADDKIQNSGTARMAMIA
jgi:hypothetical protein